MTVYRFKPHAKTFKKRVACPGCGKKMSRQTTFSATQNPFNVNKETGLPKTLPEIYESLNIKGQAWLAEESDEACAGCQPEGSGAA